MWTNNIFRKEKRLKQMKETAKNKQQNRDRLVVEDVIDSQKRKSTDRRTYVNGKYVKLSPEEKAERRRLRREMLARSEARVISVDVDKEEKENLNGAVSRRKAGRDFKPRNEDMEMEVLYSFMKVCVELVFFYFILSRLGNQQAKLLDF